MKKPAAPPDETLRLRVLQSLKLLDTQPEERFDRITRLARKMFDVPIALVSLVDAQRQWFKSQQGLEASETSREVSFCGHAILKDAALTVPDALEDPRFADNPLVVGEPKIRFYAGHPVCAPGGARVGTLCIIDREPRTLSADDLKTLADFASMVEREFALVAQSTTDELTKIANRRGFAQIADHVVALCRRSGRTATVTVMDLDGFKQINDTQGHEAGDDVLRDFARLLIKEFRDSDVVARLGGDEFAVLSSGTSAALATRALDRLAEAFARSSLAQAHPDLRWSFGIAELDPTSAADIDTLLRVADEKMYGNKARTKADGHACGSSA